jgi:hypothetical protein
VDDDDVAVEDGPLPPNWQEVAAPDGDGVYYWNEVTDVTSWERPKSIAVAKSAPSTNACGSSSGGGAGTSADGAGSAGGGGAEEGALPAGWKKVFHAATGQVMYEHLESKEQRWTAPTAADDKSDIKPKQALSEYVFEKFLLLVPSSTYFSVLL